MTKPATLKLLLIEDNPGDARLVREMLREVETHRYELSHAWCLNDALEHLEKDQFDVALVDLSLPDAHGLCTVNHLQNAVPKLPIVILSGTDDESLARQAVLIGAQDYLVKGLGDSYLLSRSLDYAIERKERQAQLLYLAQFDQLTGLPNRQLFRDRLDGALRRAQRRGDLLALMFIDLDHFKFINDNLGHDCGDELLKAAAQRMQHAVRAEDTVARLGGDEFTVIVEEIARPEDATAVAQKILQAIAEPFEIDGHRLSISGSIGIAIYPDDAAEVESLIRGADGAMYRVKAQGRNDYRFLASLDADASAQRGTQTAMRYALKREEFRIYYQPQYDLDSGRLVSMEALLRWQHPPRGVLTPESFLLAQEGTGLIVQVGEWVLREVCEQQRLWREAGLPPIPIAINVSAQQLKDGQFVNKTFAALDEAGVPAQSLIVEVAESVLMERRGIECDSLLRLTQGGVLLAVDAFGTGYSSVRRLCQLGIHTFKIDRTLVEDLGSGTNTRVIEAILALGHGMGARVVAIGVETQQQLALLRRHGCDGVQGYLLAEPCATKDQTNEAHTHTASGTGEGSAAAR